MTNVIFGSEYDVLPALLAEVRVRQGMSQRELARRMRRSPSHIHRIEHRQRRVEVVEFCNFITACGGDPAEVFLDLLARLGKADGALSPPQPMGFSEPPPVETSRTRG